MTEGTGDYQTADQDLIGIVNTNRSSTTKGYAICWKTGAGAFTVGTIETVSQSATHYQIKLTVNGTVAKLYIDDVLKQTETVPDFSTLTHLMIGNDSTGGGPPNYISTRMYEWTVRIEKTREESTYDSNYKAVHHLQGNSTDSTAYGNDGTNTAVAWEQQNGSVGLVANGTSTIINFGSDTSLDNTYDSGGTDSFIINPKSDGGSNSGRIYDKRFASGRMLRVTSEVSGFVKLDLWQDFSTTDGQWTTTNAVIPLNEITILTVKYNSDNVANDPIFIINGITYTVGNGLTETTTPSGTRSTDDTQALVYGGASDASLLWDGFIDNAKISDKIRPSSEAITSYNAEKADSDIITKGTKVTQ